MNITVDRNGIPSNKIVNCVYLSFLSTIEAVSYWVNNSSGIQKKKNSMSISDRQTILGSRQCPLICQTKSNVVAVPYLHDARLIDTVFRNCRSYYTCRPYYGATSIISQYVGYVHNIAKIRTRLNLANVT